MRQIASPHANEWGDLILSKNNPLAMLATLRAPMGVMIKGQWRDAAALNDLTDGVRQSYRQAGDMPRSSACP